jgi:hypothetical protein
MTVGRKEPRPSNMVDYLYNAAEISSDVHDDIEAAMENNSMTWQDPT